MTKTVYLKRRYRFYRTFDNKAICHEFVETFLADGIRCAKDPEFIRLSVANKRPHEAGWKKMLIKVVKDKNGYYNDEFYFVLNNFYYVSLPEQIDFLRGGSAMREQVIIENL